MSKKKFQKEGMIKKFHQKEVGKKFKTGPV